MLLCVVECARLAALLAAPSACLPSAGVGQSASEVTRLPAPLHVTSAIRADELCRWSAELMRPGISGLFLHGVAGIGKSALAAHIADRISSEHPGMRVTTITGALTVEQLVATLVTDSPSLVVLDQFDANVSDGTITDRGLAAVLVCLAEEIADHDRPARVIVTARQPLVLSPHLQIGYIGPLTFRSAEAFARSLPQLGKLTNAEREYAWRLTAGNPGSLRALDERLAVVKFAKVADRLARAIAARTGLSASLIFPTVLEPASETAMASAAESVLGPHHSAGPPGSCHAAPGPYQVATPVAAAPYPVARRPRRPRRRVLPAALVAAALVAAAIACAAFAIRPLVTGSAQVADMVAAARPVQASGPVPEPAQAAAASWLASNITAGTLIGCDPAMCTSLSRQGLAQADLSPLRPGTDLTADSLIVATPLDGARLDSAIAAAAPELAASFGAGSGRVRVWEVTPGGAAAYSSGLLAADIASRRSGGTLILGNTNIKASGDTPAILRSGQADSRILLALAEISHSAPLTIASFGTTSPGAAAAVPLRSVLIDVADPAAAAAYLKVQDPAMQPLAVRIGPGSLWVEFGAPCPLGLFQARS